MTLGGCTDNKRVDDWLHVIYYSRSLMEEELVDFKRDDIYCYAIQVMTDSSKHDYSAKDGFIASAKKDR